jgi:cell division septal protein FtsQ
VDPHLPSARPADGLERRLVELEQRVERIERAAEREQRARRRRRLLFLVGIALYVLLFYWELSKLI